MELAITLDNRLPEPLHRQLYEELRRAILTCRLKPGERLPSTRALANSLGVSRATVTLGYEQLIAEGYLEAVIGSGTRVCVQLPDDLLRTAPLSQSQTISFTLNGSKAGGVKLSAYGEYLDDSRPLEGVDPDLPISFKTGRPALEEFPVAEWRRLLLRHCRTASARLLDYAPEMQGDPQLREAICSYLGRSRAVRSSVDQIIIINGSQQAIDLVTKILIERGDTVAVENPGYLGARRAFWAQGAKLIPIPVDESGIVVEAMDSKAAARAKLVYVTPSHQFPTGAILPLQRRLELLQWAERRGAVIIEDDYDSEFRFGSRPIPALQGLSDGNNVIYVGTFSKVLFPSLRIGYMVVPESLVRVFTRARWIADRQTPTLEQLALADFLNEGHLERHLRRMRTLYDKRRQALIRALNLHFEDRVHVLGENAGLHLMARLQTNFSDEEVVSRAADAGVGVLNADIYYLREAHSGEFVFGYGGLSERRISEGIKRLAKALR
jgi:GntR family transcriptional regulator/MocR family aminotransferase